MARIPKWGQQLKERIETGEGYQYKNEGKKATWRADYLKDLPTKQYGRSYDDKLTTFVKSMGGDEKEAKQFRTWMNQRESGELQKNIDYQKHLSKIEKQNEENKRNQEQFGNLVAQLKSVRGEPVGNQRTLSGQYRNGAQEERDGLLGFLDRYVTPFSQGAKDFIAPGLTEQEAQLQMERKGQLNPITQAALQDRGLETDILKGAGYVAGATMPVGQGYKVANLALRGLTKGNTLASKLGYEALRGTTAAGVTGVGQSLANEGFNPDAMNLGDYAKRTGIEMAIGGVADPAVMGISQLVRGLRNVKPPTTPNVVDDVAEQINPTVETPQIQPNEWLQFGQQTKNIPKARLQPPDIKVFEDANAPGGIRPQGYWKKRYEDFVQHVNGTYDKNQLTQESLEDAWTQFARPDEDVNLEQLIDLYGKDMRRIQEDITPKLQFGQANKSQARISTNQGSINNDLVERLTKINSKEPSLKRISKEQVENISPETFKDSGVSMKRLPKEPVENISVEKEPKVTNKELQELKDISQFQVGTQNIYQLAERLPKEQRTRIVSTLDNAKKANVDHQEKLTNDLYTKVVKDLGIKKGSKDSALVQDFGEKTLAKKYLRKQGIDPKKLSEEELNKINLEQLKKQYPEKWEKIVEADKYFREQYDQLIEQVNAVRKQLYPNNPDKLVPKRQDYYHHFNELEGFEGIKNLFETPASIDPHLSGVSPFTKPKAKFQGFMQRRGNGKYKSDAVGGFLNYLKASSHSIHIDPVISVLRNTKKEIADATTETRNANYIIEALEDHANDLAGKTNPYDRLIQKIIGRKGVRLVSTVNSRVKSNMIVGNLASALGQLGSAPLGVAKAKQYAVPGLVDTLTQTANQILSKSKNVNAPISKSQFIKERYSDKFYRKFDQKLLDQPKKLAVWILETVEKSGTDFIWNSMYRQGLGKKVKDPIKYADDQTRHIVAGRGVGEVPLLQKAKTTQILAPFTLEVGNQWTVLKKMVGEKDAAGLMTFLIASYGLNKAMEQVRGNGVSLDPVGAIKEGYEKGEGGTGAKVTNAGASLLGEVVGNIPGGNLLTSQVNTDKKVPFTDLQYKKLFGERDPNRFGTGLTVSKAVQDPLFAVLPFGASQVRKSTQGIDAIRNEAVYKGDNSTIPFMGPKKELAYPVKTNPLNKLKMGTMGPSSTSDAREYYDNERKTLTEHQTNAFKRMKEVGLENELYDILRKSDTSSYNKGKITKIEKDDELSDSQKVEKLMELIRKLQK